MYKNYPIRSLSLFSALTDEQFTLLQKKSYITTLTKDQALFTLGNKADYFYVLLSGQLKLSLHTVSGTEKILTLIHPMELFAEAVMFLEKDQYPVNATALQESEVIGFSNQLFMSFLREYPKLSLKLLSVLSGRLHQQINEIRNLSLQSSQYRVLNYLNSLITEHNKNQCTIYLDTSKKNLASRLSITPETLSRTLHRAKSDKMIDTDGKKITIHNIQAFKKYLIEQ